MSTYGSRVRLNKETRCGWFLGQLVVGGLLAIGAVVPVQVAVQAAPVSTEASASQNPLRIQAREILSTRKLRFNPEALRRAIADLSATYPQTYTHGSAFLKQLEGYERKLPELVQVLEKGEEAQLPAAFKTWEELLAFQRTVLLANPLLDFDQFLFIQHAIPKKTDNFLPEQWEVWMPRKPNNYTQAQWDQVEASRKKIILENFFGQPWAQVLNLPQNWACDFTAKAERPCWDDAIALTSIRHPDKPDTTVFKPQAGHCIQHLELNFDADKMLFSMAGTNKCWQVHEIAVDGNSLRQVNAGTEPDVDNGDACYLPDGRIIFNSNRAFTGVPCHDGSTWVANLCLMNADGTGERMLTFDQESNFHPSLLNDGRILYLRYEYANTSHQFPGLLFHMNPDGTGQMAYYGSNSYWPNRVFFPRAIPGHPTMVVGIVTGHHAPHRVGKLVLFDPARGRFEADGVVQAIPGYGKKVKPEIADGLYDKEWPKFTHPYPLNDKYFLVSGKLSYSANCCIWLVDVFDNMTLLKEIPGSALFDPIPLKKTIRPRVIPDKVKLGEKTATVYIQDLYRGYPMAGIPRGTVKRLRIYSYNYMYRGLWYARMGHLVTPGMDGPWEPRYLLGTVPVSEDGSAYFKIPANTPIAIQPLDGEGRAVQVMRSWFTGMPGEFVSCVGCHESQNSAPPLAVSLAQKSPPAMIEPWRGPARGFDFEREVQPVLDKYCVGCHQAGSPGGIDLSRKTPEEKKAITLKYADEWHTKSIANMVFTPSYLALQPRVYRPFAESNYHPHVAMEFFADKSPLVRMLKKGHHNVQLDREAWDRIYTWIDLAAPDHGTWTRFAPKWMAREKLEQRRQVMLKQYAHLDYNYESLPPDDKSPDFVAPAVPPAPATVPVCAGWPFDAATAKKRQAETGLPLTRSVDLGNGKTIGFVLIPAGEFVMGDANGPDDERKLAKVTITKPFYMSVREISNDEYRSLVPGHDSGYVSSYGIDLSTLGTDVNGGRQPAVRMSWNQAVAFCKSLSAKCGRSITLPTEGQWEWACRAGTQSDMWYGTKATVFSAFENLADVTMKRFASGGKYWFLRDDNSNDTALVSTACGSYQSNPWGLYDMHGNVSEWTLSEYRPYPYVERDGRNVAGESGLKVVRGGSWWDRPCEATSTWRWRYYAWEKAYNVGFRVVMEAGQ